MVITSIPLGKIIPWPRLGAVVMIGLAGWGTSGCRDARQQAILELERRQIPVVPAALATAVVQRDSRIIEFLRVAGVKAALPEGESPSVLHLAAAQKDWEQVLHLMDFCNVETINHKGPGGQTVLEMAVLAQEFSLSRKLIAAGAKPEPAACGVNRLLEVAEENPALVEDLLACLPDGHAAFTPALMRAVQAGQELRVQHLLARKAALGGAAPDGQGTALEIACGKGFFQIATDLLKAGANPALSPNAMVLSVKRRNADLTRLLLEAGGSPNTPADPEQPDSSPLHAALSAGDMDLTALMLKHGANPGPCVEFALAKGDTALLDLLHAHEVPLEATDEGEDPLIIRAAIAGQAGVVRKLLELGVSRDTPGLLGQSAYHMAVIHRKSDVMDVLLEAGVPPDAPFAKPAPEELLPLFGSDYFTKWYKRDDHLTPLMLAASRGDVPQLRQLLKAGAKRGAQTKGWHRYPIVFACETVNIPAAQVLLGRNPDEEEDKRHAIISLSRQRVTLFKNDQVVRSARVSTGKKSTPTPTGKYVITDKQVHWVSSIYKVPMPYFMRLSCKEIGLHAGVVPGYPASHGCIRMPKGEVQAFFKMLKIGDPVTIEY